MLNVRHLFHVPVWYLKNESKFWEVATGNYVISLMTAAYYGKHNFTRGLQTAVAEQTARSRCKVLSIPYVYYFRPTKGSGTEDKSFTKKSGN